MVFVNLEKAQLRHLIQMLALCQFNATRIETPKALIRTWFKHGILSVVQSAVGLCNLGLLLILFEEHTQIMLEREPRKKRHTP